MTTNNNKQKTKTKREREGEHQKKFKFNLTIESKVYSTTVLTGLFACMFYFECVYDYARARASVCVCVCVCLRACTHHVLIGHSENKNCSTIFQILMVASVVGKVNIQKGGGGERD